MHPLATFINSFSRKMIFVDIKNIIQWAHNFYNKLLHIISSVHSFTSFKENFHPYEHWDMVNINGMSQDCIKELVWQVANDGQDNFCGAQCLS